LDSYWVSDLLVRYIINAKSNKKPSIELGAQVNNLFDKDYLSNAWVYSYIYDGQRDVFDGYFPQAGIHFMGQVLIRF
jgi:iron complex outermembrane receptor protein